MKVRSNLEQGWVDPAADLDTLPEWLPMLDDGGVVFVEKLSSVQWSIYGTAPDLDGIGSDGRYPAAGWIAYVNRRPDGGWVTRLEEHGAFVSLSGGAIEGVVSDLLNRMGSPQ